jgi:type VI secretion system protein VasD
MKFLKYLLMMCVSLFLVACNAVPKQNAPQDSIDVYIFADEDINPNILNDPSPVKVNILQLKTEVEFNQMSGLSPDGMYKQHLGESVVDDISMMVRPKTHMEFKLPNKRDVDYLGVVVAYRDLDNKWKMSLYKQDKRWYQNGGEYLYLNVRANGVEQIGKKDALNKLLNEKLEKEGKKISSLTEKEKKKMLDDLEKVMDKKKAANLKKGIYISTEATQ